MTPDQLEMKSYKPRLWPLFPAAVTEGVVASLLQGVAIFLLLVLNKDPETSVMEALGTLQEQLFHPPFFVVLLACSGLSMILGGVGFGGVSARNRGCRISDRLGLSSPALSGAAWITLLIGSIPVLLVSVGAVALLEQFIKGDESILKLYENMTNGWAIVFIVSIGVLPGLGEELLFRGFIQRRLLQRFSPTVAIGITSFVFGLCHVTPHAIVLATIIGVWLGLMAYRTNSIWPGVFVHAFINSGWNVYQVGRYHWGIPTVPPAWFLVIGGLVTTAAFFLALRMLVMRQLPDSLGGVKINQWSEKFQVGNQIAA